MIEFFKTLSSYWDKLVTLFDTIFSNAKEAVSEVQYWIGMLPPALVASFGIIIVVIIIYLILGRG